MCTDDLVSSLFWPLSFEDIDVFAAFETCTASCKHEEVSRVSRNAIELIGQDVNKLHSKVMVSSKINFSLSFFVLTPQVLQAP